MVWAWTLDPAAGPTTVTFELAADGAGTRLTLRHFGEIEPFPGRLLREGWPGKIDALRRTIERA